MRRGLSHHFAETVCGMSHHHIPKHIFFHQALKSNGQYKTIIMAGSQSISSAGQTSISLCFQII